MEQFSLNMGVIIRELRKSKSFTQDALAQAAGVSIQAVSKWETGQSLPDVTLLPAIADFLGTSVDALFGRASAADSSSAGAEETASPCPDSEEPASSSIFPESEEPASSSVFPDDGKLRVVQYMGSRLMSAEECTDKTAIPLSLTDYEGTLAIHIEGGARIEGTVNGSVDAKVSVTCNASVNGPVTAGGNVLCNGNINGPVSSGGELHVKGSISGVDLGSMGAKLGSDLGNMGVKLGQMLGSLFGNRRAGNVSGAHMTAFFSGELPDDDVLRIVQMKGRRLLSVEESTGSRGIRLAVDHLDGPLNTEIYGSAEIQGDVGGNATAGDALTCGNVGGNASAGDSLNCGNVGGSATAGDGLSCGNVGGNVRAGDSVRVDGSVNGSVSAGDHITCGNIAGDAKADSIRCASVSGRGAEKARPEEPVPSACAAPDPASIPTEPGVLTVVQVLNGRVLSAQESRQDRAISLSLDDADGISLHVQGDLSVSGCISGDVRADGSVNCGGSIEGDVTAGADVSCGDIEGCVTAGAEVTCASVGESVTAGMAVHCGDVGGDVSVSGANDTTTVECGEIDGCLSVKGGSVSCGEISGDATIEGNDATTLTCGDIDGCLTMKGASVQCGTISGDVTIEGNDAGSLTCGDIGGCLSAKCAIVQCGGIWGDAVIEGNAPGSFTCNGDIGGGVYHQ